MASSTDGRHRHPDAVRLRASAIPAFQHTCRQVEPLRRLAAADMAAGEVGGIAGQAGGAQLEHGLDLTFRQAKPGKGVQAVEQQRLQLRVRHILLRKDLRNLCKIRTQRQLGQIPAQGRKQLDGLGFVDGVLSPVFKQRELPVGKQLARGDQRAVFPPRPRRLHGESSMGGGSA